MTRYKVRHLKDSTYQVIDIETESENFFRNTPCHKTATK